MAPAEVSETIATYPLHNLKTINRAMEFPVVSDTVGEVAKYANTLRNYSTVQTATNVMQAGLKTIADFRPVAAVKEAVLKSSTVSDVLLPRMVGAVESLDSMAANQLDHLKTAVPAMAEPTPQLIESTKLAASGYWSRTLDYLSSFTIAQVSLGLADKSLDVAANVVAKVGKGVAPALEDTSDTVAKATSSLFSRLQENIGGVRDVVQDLKKRGEPAATDLAAKVGQLFDYLRLDSILGYLGLSLQAKEVEKGVAEAETSVKKGVAEAETSVKTGVAEAETSVKKGVAEAETSAAAMVPDVKAAITEATTAKRSADTDTSDEED